MSYASVVSDFWNRHILTNNRQGVFIVWSGSSSPSPSSA
jgi:hypothetical protein